LCLLPSCLFGHIGASAIFADCIHAKNQADEFAVRVFEIDDLAALEQKNIRLGRHGCEPGKVRKIST
jgi:hypothetical protein